MEETEQINKSGYGKRPLWQWLTIYIVIGAVVYGAIYYFVLGKKNGYNYNQPQQQYSQPTARVSPSPLTMETTLILKPVNNSDQQGTAILKEENGQTKITINLTGYTKDVKQPAHIHIGECPGVGSVRYPLTPVVNGTSTTTLSVTLESLKKELPLAINVHKSAAEVSVYTSCGSLNIQ